MQTRQAHVTGHTPPEVLPEGIGQHLCYLARQIVFHQGDPSSCAYYIVNGTVKLSALSSQGKEGIVAILGADEFFGEACLAGQPRRLTTATAMSDCEVVRLEKAVALRLIHETPSFAESFVEHILTRSVRTEADLIDHLFNSSEKRLARILLILANFGESGQPRTKIAKFSQETLAEMVGTTRSRVSQFMNKFRKLGYIDYDGTSIEVRNALLNVVLYDTSDPSEE